MKTIVTELMIGDWVLYTSDTAENSFPVQVTLDMMCNEMKKWPDRFEYIPITPEFLIKNGFIAKNETHLIYEYPFDNDTLLFIRFAGSAHYKASTKTYDFTWKVDSPWTESFPIKYIHDFQHLLHSLKSKVDLKIIN